MTTIERISRALFDAECELCADFVIVPETWETTKRRHSYLFIAKADLQALRQVDEGTVEAMAAERGWNGLNRTRDTASLAGRAFKSILQGILSQGGEA